MPKDTGTDLRLPAVWELGTTVILQGFDFTLRDHGYSKLCKLGSPRE
jgi:hypothetical protein